jgi:NADH-quinone oxidoreductase subunit J
MVAEGARGTGVEQVIQPLILYLACGLGAIGVMFAMPRRRGGIAAIGGVVAAIAGGGVLLGLLLVAGPAGQLPNIYFYFFGVLALASGLRMITHPRPVYAALYFILTIVASSGLYVLLSAEFMAFAMIIIYAGAILITYLFVIMLATQAPTDDDEESLTEYDAVAREPVAASLIGFSMLALLTTVMFNGLPTLQAYPRGDLPDQTLGALPLKIDRELMPILRAEGLVQEGEVLAMIDGRVPIDTQARTVQVAAGEISEGGVFLTEGTRLVGPVDPAIWPKDLAGTNVEGLGLNLLGKHPMTIEIAGVVLLMAMLGATVLARKQVDLEDELKRRMARRLAIGEEDAS